MAEDRSHPAAADRVGRAVWRPSLRWVLNVVLFNGALAVPLALMTVSSGADWMRGIIGGSTYTQAVGGMCFLGGALMEGRCASLSGGRRRALGLSINLLLAVIGGLLAGFLLTT